MAKRARELAVKEKRDLKRERKLAAKAERAAAKTAGTGYPGDDGDVAGDGAQPDGDDAESVTAERSDDLA
jgi:hypothetical protein